MRMISFSICASKRSAESSNLTQEVVRKRTNKTIAALSSCPMTVASATPATPMEKTLTNKRSSTVLAAAQTIRNSSGRTESPTARRMPAPML